MNSSMTIWVKGRTFKAAHWSSEQVGVSPARPPTSCLQHLSRWSVCTRLLFNIDSADASVSGNHRFHWTRVPPLAFRVSKNDLTFSCERETWSFNWLLSPFLVFLISAIYEYAHLTLWCDLYCASVTDMSFCSHYTISSVRTHFTVKGQYLNRVTEH